MIHGGVPKLQCFFLKETDKYSGLCEQERYRNGTPVRWLPKGSAFCHALILRDAEESLYRRFGSQFGLGGITFYYTRKNTVQAAICKNMIYDS